MSDLSQDKTSQPARPVSRWRIGSLSVIQIALVAVILIAVNYLSSQYYQRRDLSRAGDFMLSSATIRYLQSPAVQQRKDPIQFIVAFRMNADFYDRVRVLVEEYARQSGGKVKLRLIDPVRNPDEAQELAATYGVYDPGNNQLSRKDLVIIDSRTAEQIEAAKKEKIPSANNVRIVPSDALATYEVDEKKQRRPATFQGEDLLTAGLRASIEGVPRKVYFLADKSRISAEGEHSPWKTLVTAMALQNVILVPITLADKTEIPEDATAVAMVAPKYDFTPAEMNVIQNYWNRPKSALFVLLSPEEVPARLRGFLRSNGVTPRRDRVITTRGGQTISAVNAAFTAGVPFLKDLTGQATVFEGASSSLEVRENNDEDLATRRIAPVPLIQVDSAYWGETKFGQGKESYDEREDKSAPLYLAAGVTRGAESDDRFTTDSSRMLVMSNSDFLEPERLRQENLDFLSASTNWLIGREELAGIGARTLGTYKLPLLDAQVSFINRVNLFFLPGIALLIAGFVWSSRRA